jgi:hypothetical protein
MSVAASSNAKSVQIASDQLLRRLEGIQRLLNVTASAQEVNAELTDAVDDCLATLRQTKLWGQDNRLLSSELWNRAGHYLARGWLQNRARTKPRGYAGDYELLARLYENRCCDDPLGQLFDGYFQLQAAPQAVRNRMQMMADWFIGEATAQRLQDGRPRKVAVVGSAFGLDVRDALVRLDENSRQHLHVTLLDVDPQAIEFACQQILPLLPAEQLQALCSNPFRLPDRPRAAAALAGMDLLVCPGIFDYLDDLAGAAMLRTLYAQLAAGGRLIVFQFAPHCTTRAYMEWLANWYLLYRDANQFHRLVESAELSDASAHFSAEPLGVDLYVEIRRPM